MVDEKKDEVKLKILPVQITAVSVNGGEGYAIVAKVQDVNGATVQEVVLKKAPEAREEEKPDLPSEPPETTDQAV